MHIESYQLALHHHKLFFSSDPHLRIDKIGAGADLSDFTMGTILGKGFPQAQVHTVHSSLWKARI